MSNSKKKCRYCGQFKSVEGGIVVPLGFFCSSEERNRYGIENSKKLIEKARQSKIRDLYRAPPKRADKTQLSWQKEATQKAFNKMRVAEELLWFKEKGLEPVCISCSKPIGGDVWACGHYKTRGGFPELAYDRRNSFLQHNRGCNSALSGNISGTKTTHGYEAGLILRFGEQEGQRIMDYCNSHRPINHLKKEDYEAMRKEFNATYREVKKKLELL